MIKVMSVFGTRPEAIKMAPVVKELEKYPDMIQSIVCVTGQHREMLDQVLKTFNIEPDYDLAIMQKGQTLSDITRRILMELDEVLADTKPNLVLVHGDTTTAMTAALAATYRQIKVGHVEAGLRTYDKSSPFPEEINRQVIGVLADLHFAPTDLARHHLSLEQKNGRNVWVTGNTAIDALKTTVRRDYSHPVIDSISMGHGIIFLTCHRRENQGEPMENIFRAIRRLVNDHPHIEVIYPVHLNPKIQELAHKMLGCVDRIHLIDPLDPFDAHNFMNKADLILTDSGGIQEEAPSLNVPVLVLRKETERPEGVNAGVLRLIGTEENDVYNETLNLLRDRELYINMSNAQNPYGDGTASEKIVRIILGYFSEGSVLV
jgi:UDP-N-acetylglucosamine 2-epimerase (non-hydrolysing)